MAYKPASNVEAFTVVPPNSWNGSLILLVVSFMSPFGSPAGSSRKETAPRVSRGSNLILSRDRGSSRCTAGMHAHMLVGVR